MEFADVSTMVVHPGERNWVDRYHECDENMTKLLCTKCNEYFLGWKLRRLCRICNHPIFPTNGVRHITHSATIIKGVVYALPAPSRHPDCWHAFRVLTGECTSMLRIVEGFLDNRGKFVSRYDAARIAVKAGQVAEPQNIRWIGLHSEDVW